MSLYVEWINAIKSRATPDWLTYGQRAAYDALLHQWPHARLLCLRGPKGSGKSFIARLLAHQEGFFYAQTLDEIPEGTPRVVLDDTDYYRLLNEEMSWRGVSQLVITSERQPSDPIPGPTIRLATRDVNEFRARLVAEGVLSVFRRRAEGTDLGAMLRAEAVERSQSDGPG